jgi:hypothetical protein
MSADTSWTQRCRSWVAPPPPWVAVARDREGNPIGTGPRLLLVYYWGLADAPSKREPGPVTLDVRDEKRRPEVLRRQVAAHFDVGLSTLKGWERTLREAGLLARPAEGVIVLADVAATGYHHEDMPGVRDTQGVEFSTPVGVKNMPHTGQESAPRGVKNLPLGGSEFRPSGGQDLAPAIRKPDLPDQDPIYPTLREEGETMSEYQRAEQWCTRHREVGQAAMSSRWTLDLKARMRDGLTLDEVQRIVGEHVRQTAEHRRSGTLAREHAKHADRRSTETGIPPLSGLWSGWSKAVAWRAAALGQGVSVEPRSSFAGGTRAGLEALDEQRRRSDEARERKRRGEPCT